MELLRRDSRRVCSSLIELPTTANITVDPFIDLSLPAIGKYVLIQFIDLVENLEV